MKNQPTDYEQETIAEFERLLQGITVNSDNVCFTDQINVNNDSKKHMFKNQLILAINEFF